MDNIRVSVALASYNGMQHIGEQITTILNNLSSYDELVISDDGSTDETIEIIKSFQSKDKRIKLFYGNGKGVKHNFSTALSNCRGQYIFLCDQDDVWFENKVSVLIEYLDKHDLVVHDCIVTDEDPNDVIYNSYFTYKKSGPGVIKNIIQNTYIGCCMAFSRELLKKILPIPERIAMHDQWIGILNDVYFKNTLFLNQPLIYYRRSGNNVSSFNHYPLSRMVLNRILFIQELLKKVSAR
ncbi:glycosyltransferase family 2 protein [Limosilactobacillus fermentum]|uniref:glycosyltransferase family 2 protein n=1 Tax=Limosilactobacillus fermentum TaxID=1613 RepID=UPI002F269CFD